MTGDTGGEMWRCELVCSVDVASHTRSSCSRALMLVCTHHSLLHQPGLQGQRESRGEAGRGRGGGHCALFIVYCSLFTVEAPGLLYSLPWHSNSVAAREESDGTAGRRGERSTGVGVWRQARGRTDGRAGGRREGAI
ncbi:hypothetical protein KC19_5G183400 [Ceratodon purpureus]|uniref:Uncharacterized protein n=1 Tax=Ceratodon purpureus TaxID=3225 RepID=A0A8T0I2Y4_CERPU|nr:hypothetical protein KC19_5G183400 [Ceratodon purpureus]